jgi:hypothetical protein
MGIPQSQLTWWASKQYKQSSNASNQAVNEWVTFLAFGISATNFGLVG